MIRRTIVVAFVAAGIAFAPTAASAYVAPSPSPSPEEDVSGVSCSVTSIQAGGSFTCTVRSTLGGSAQLQATSGSFTAGIAGTATSGAKAFAAGAAAFTVSTPEDASGTVTVTGFVDEEPVGTVDVAVTSSGVSPVAGEEPAEVVAEDSSEALAATGFEGGLMAAGAGLLLVAGAATVVAAGRRSSEKGVS